MSNDLPVRHMQATFTPDEYREIEQFLLDNGIRNRREWLRQVALKEVRKDGSKSVSVHE